MSNMPNRIFIPTNINMFNGQSVSGTAWLDNSSIDLTEWIPFAASRGFLKLPYVLVDGNTDNKNIVIGTNDNFDFSINTNSLSRMIIKNDGRIGIATPAFVPSNTQFYLKGFGNSSATNAFVIHNSTGTNNSFVVRDDGNIGIGNSSPLSRLHISLQDVPSVTMANSRNTLVLEGSVRNGISFRSADSTDVGLVWNSPSSGTFGSCIISHNYSTGKLEINTNQATGHISFGTAGAVEKMRILANGNVGIGTVNPITKFDVVDSVNTFAMKVQGSGSTNFVAIGTVTGGAVIAGYTANFGALANLTLQPSVSGTVTIGTVTPQSGNILTVNGSIAATSSSITVWSDKDAKQDITNYEYGLEQVLKIEPVRFKYKKSAFEGVDTSIEYVGIIAQDIEKVMPETVSTYKVSERDEEGNIVYDEAGNPLEKDMKSFKGNSDLVYALINAIKELTSRIEALEASLK